MEPAAPVASGQEPKTELAGVEKSGGVLAVSTSELILVGLLIGLILVSIVGNCLVCVAIFTDRRLRKLGNAFIVSLAIADLFVSCLVMTFALCNDLMGHWIFGAWFCDVWISFDIMCCTASILNLCAISLDRFIHIKDCLLYNQWMTRRVAISAVIIIWFISALVSFVPINLGWHRPPMEPGVSLAFGVARTLEPATWEQGAEQQQQQQRSEARKLNYSPNGAAAAASSGRRPIEEQSWPGVELAAGRQLSEAPNSSRPTTSAASYSANRVARRGAADFVTLKPTASSGSPRPPGCCAQFNKVESNPQDGSQIGLDPEQHRQRQWRRSSGSSSSKLVKRHQQQQGGELPLCMLTLTPTYAVISSTISFYIPCIIMLGLYTKLFACARRHVRNIQAVSMAPMALSAPGQLPPAGAARPRSRLARAWLTFGRRPARARAARDQAAQDGAGPPAGATQALKHDKDEAGRRAHMSQVAAGASSSSNGRAATARSGGQAGSDIVREPPAMPINKKPMANVEGSGSRVAPSELAIGQLRGLAQSRRRSSLSSEAADKARVQLLGARSLEAGESESGSGTEPPPPPPLSGPAWAEQCPFLEATNGGNGGGASTGPLERQPTSSSQRSAMAAANYAQQQRAQGQLATHKAAVTLGIIMGTFLFCWVPFFCLNIIKAFCVDCIPGSLFRAFTWLGYANSALNPIIYGIHNTEFRCAFNRIFFKHLNIKNSRYYLNRRYSYDLRRAPREGQATPLAVPFRHRAPRARAADGVGASTAVKEFYKPDTLR